MKGLETSNAPISWKAHMQYEKVEILAALQHIFSRKIFQSDNIRLVELTSLLCASHFDPPSVVDTLCVDGRVSPLRAELLKIVFQKLKLMVSDCILKVEFSVRVADPIPDAFLEPLQSTSQIKAIKSWHRAAWACRCGTLKKIADARGVSNAKVITNRPQLGQLNAPSTSSMLRPSSFRTQNPKRSGSEVPMMDTEIPTVSEQVQRVRRPFKPLSLYHKASQETKVCLHRFASNCPAVFVFWASWNDESMQFLRQKLFNPDRIRLIIEKEEKELSADQKGTKGHASDASLDPWLGFVVEHVGPLIQSSAPPPVQSVDERSSNAQPSRARRGPNKKSTPLQHRVTNLSSTRVTRRANIVLIALDTDVGEARSAIEVLRREAKHWISDLVSLNVLWAGKDGMHSETAAVFDTKTLPLVLGVRAPTVIFGKEIPTFVASSAHPTSCVTSVPSVFSATTFPVPIVRFDQSATGGVAVSPSSDINQPSIPAAQEKKGKNVSVLWHHLPEAERISCVDSIVQGLKNVSAPLVFESKVTVTHSTTELYRSESDCIAKRCCDSLVQLSGNCTQQDLNALGHGLRTLRARVSNFDFNVFVMQRSGVLQLPLNARTAEHIVHGWLDDVTCGHCGQRVHISQSVHFHCLNCLPPNHPMLFNKNTVGDPRTICETCFNADKHPVDHILLKVPVGSPSELSLLWGDHNLAPLPTERGTLYESTCRWHTNVYCDACHIPITGRRWKCACCLDFDFCASCEAQWYRNQFVLNRVDRHHPRDHLFFLIRCAVPGDSNCCLVPNVEI